MALPRRLLSLSLLAVASCSKSGSDSASPPPAPVAVTPSATATTTVAATASVAPTRAEPPVYAPHKVAAGLAGEVWLPSFEVVRDKGHLATSYIEAMSACTATGKSLCTDAQWTRACDTDPALAAIETWTASGVGGARFIVRGGTEAGCRGRNVADASEKQPSRAAVCCDRAVGIKTNNKNEAFLKTSEKRLLDYEAAIRARDTLTLSSLYDDKVSFLGKEYANAALLKMHEQFFQRAPDQWTVFDSCDVNIEKGADVKLGANCRTLFHRNGSVVVAMQRFVWGGAPTMKLQTIGETVAHAQAPDGTMIEEKETKERVGILLAAD